MIKNRKEGAKGDLHVKKQMCCYAPLFSHICLILIEFTLLKILIGSKVQFLLSSSVLVICTYRNWLEFISWMLNSSTMYFSVIYHLIKEWIVQYNLALKVKMPKYFSLISPACLHMSFLIFIYSFVISERLETEKLITCIQE